MKILAFDSSGLVASVAVLEEEQLIAEYTINYKKTHSQTLLPMLDAIVKMTELDLDTVDAIAVAAGPGSFTGLRIGSATAKGLGLALNKPLVSVPTLEGIAYNLYGSEAVLCPMMDARRDQVYTGLYTFKKDTFRILHPQTACPVDEILTLCRERREPVIFLGDGVPVYRARIEERMEGDYSFAPAHVSRQRAGAVGMRAFALLKEGRQETAAEHAPEYLRETQAERVKKAREKTAT